MTGCDGRHPESEPHQHDQHGGTSEHGHGHGVSANARLITKALALIAGFLAFDVAMAFAGHSLALLADARVSRSPASSSGSS